MNGFIKDVGLAMIVCACTLPAMAQVPAFRVDTDIYVGDAKQPLKQTLTLFSEGVYYDFAMDDSAAITVVDPQRSRIVLISPQRQAKTVIQTSQLLNLVAQARKEAASTELAGMLAAADKFTFDEKSQTVTVGDDSLRYDATLQQPRDASIAAQYADFADWSARLNAVYPPYLPPYLRLELNRQVAAKSMLPQEIKRTTHHNHKAMVVRSRLLPNWRISSDDEAKLKRVGELLVQCKEIPTNEFFACLPQTANQSGASAKKR